MAFEAVHGFCLMPALSSASRAPHARFRKHGHHESLVVAMAWRMWLEMTPNMEKTMNASLKWSGLAVLLLAGCGQQAQDSPPPPVFAEAESSAPVPDTASIKADADPQCPSQDFGKFIQVFMDDPAVQKRYVQYPYELTSYDPQDLEAGPTVAKLTAAQVEFPVILPASVLRDEHGAYVETDMKSDTWHQVVTGNVMSGEYSMTYNFKWLQGCWFLTDAVDSST